jgi:glycosyltransferase involved in cell wall biosynthesis
VTGRIGFVGVLKTVKNVDLLLHALEGCSGCELYIWGDGDQRKDLQALADKLNISVCFNGTTPNHELPVALATCQIFVLASSWEGHPKALLEAMACGLPVVATSVPGIVDLLRSLSYIALAELSSASIRAALLSAFQISPEERKVIGRANRDFVIRSFSLEAVVELERMTLSAILQS